MCNTDILCGRSEACSRAFLLFAKISFTKRPIAPDVLTQHVKTPRASRPRPHHEPHTTGGPPSRVPRPRRRSKVPGIWLIYLVLGMLMAMVLLWLGQTVFVWSQQTLDDLRYGRPRTTNIDHIVGHETGKTVTHFTALNLDGQIYVLEIPGGTPRNSHLLVGPHLYGPGS